MYAISNSLLLKHHIGFRKMACVMNVTTHNKEIKYTIFDNFQSNTNVSHGLLQSRSVGDSQVCLQSTEYLVILLI